MRLLPRLERRLSRLALGEAYNPFARYQHRPVEYAREVMRARVWSKQVEIAEKLLTPPYKVLVPSSHSVGKTWTGAWLTNWWYDTRDPSCVITTAPTQRDVEDLLWQEVRLQRGTRGGFKGASAAELRSSPNHYAKGFTASKGESFQGRHPPEFLLIFDEAVGIEEVFWRTAKTMFEPGGRHGWVCFFNPTDITAEAYRQHRQGGWHVVQMGSLEHPNIEAGLRGEDVPFPGAVTCGQFAMWVHDWCDPIEAGEATESDILWPPREGTPFGQPQWYRPGPQMESRALGRWPSQSTYSLWSEPLLAKLVENRREIDPAWKTYIGCDVASYGDDYTAIVVRRGLCLVHAELHNGWSTVQVANRLKQLALKFKGPQDHRKVQVNIDIDGLGIGVYDLADDFNFVGVHALAAPCEPERYREARSEIWDNVVRLAREGLLDCTRLPAALAEQLGQQLLAPRYTIDAAGRLRVESKDETKKRLKCSPDLADAFNLACYIPPTGRDSIG